MVFSFVASRVVFIRGVTDGAHRTTPAARDVDDDVAMPFDANVAMRFLQSARAMCASVDAERERRGQSVEALSVTTRAMFGGECVMVNGHMIGGVCSNGKGGNIMLRVGKTRVEEALTMRGVVEQTYFAGKPNWGGFVYVDVEALGLRERDAKGDSISALDEATMLAVELAAAAPEKDTGGTKKRVATGKVMTTPSAKTVKTATGKVTTTPSAKTMKTATGKVTTKTTTTTTTTTSAKTMKTATTNAAAESTRAAVKPKASNARVKPPKRAR